MVAYQEWKKESICAVFLHIKNRAGRGKALAVHGIGETNIEGIK